MGEMQSTDIVTEGMCSISDIINLLAKGKIGAYFSFFISIAPQGDHECEVLQTPYSLQEITLFKTHLSLQTDFYRVCPSPLPHVNAPFIPKVEIQRCINELLTMSPSLLPSTSLNR